MKMSIRSVWGLVIFIFLMVSFESCQKDSTVPQATPTVTGVSQNQISPGGTLTLTGTNFNATATNNTVKFGTITVDVTAATTTSLTITLPLNFAGGSYVVTVTVNGITATLVGNVDVIPNTPSITDFNPKQIFLGTGTTIIIKGSNFDLNVGDNVVIIGTTSATVTAASATQLTVTIPLTLTAGSYPIHLTIKQNGQSSAEATSAANFTLYNNPTISNFSPQQGLQGSTITITGTNFDVTPANNVVKFGTVSAEVTSASATQLLVKVPSGLQLGSSYNLSCSITANGISSASVSSTSTFSLSQVKVNNINPTSGIKNSSLFIVGENFHPVTGNNSVTINGMAAIVTVATSTQLTVKVPKGCGTGQVVVTANGQVAPGPTFTYQLSPSYTGAATGYASSPDLLGIRSLAYDPSQNILYASTNTGSGLYRIDIPVPAVNQINFMSGGLSWINFLSYSAGNLYIVSANGYIASAAISGYSGELTTLTQGLKTPFGIAYANSKLYTVEHQTPYNVKVLDLSNNNSVSTFAISSDQPNSIAMGAGKLYIASNNKVQSLSIPGAVFSDIETNPTFAGITTDDLGNIFVTKYDGSVAIIDTNGTEATLCNLFYGNGFFLTGIVAIDQGSQIILYVSDSSAVNIGYGSIFKIVVTVTMD